MTQCLQEDGNDDGNNDDGGDWIRKSVATGNLTTDSSD